MKQKIFFFRKKKFKMADSKKAHFSKSPILKIFSRKFLRFVLGLVGLNDAKGIHFAQPVWPWDCLTYAPKQAKNTKNAFFAYFGAYIGHRLSRTVSLKWAYVICIWMGLHNMDVQVGLFSDVNCRDWLCQSRSLMFIILADYNFAIRL